jgi:hypothetical protein
VLSKEKIIRHLHYLNSDSDSSILYLLSGFFPCRLHDPVFRICCVLSSSCISQIRRALLLTADISIVSAKMRQDDLMSVHDAQHSATICVSTIHILQPRLEILSAFTFVFIDILARLPHPLVTKLSSFPGYTSNRHLHIASREAESLTFLYVSSFTESLVLHYIGQIQ